MLFGSDGPKPDHGCLQLLNKAQIRRLLTTNEIVGKIFKDGPVVVSWMPYQTMSDTNVNYILSHENPVVFADSFNSAAGFDCSSASFATCVPLWAKDDPSEIHLKFDVEIYAEDRELALKHLYMQIYQQCSSIPGNGTETNVHFMIFLHCPLQREEVISVLAKLGMVERTGFLGTCDPHMVGFVNRVEAYEEKQEKKAETLPAIASKL